MKGNLTTKVSDEAQNPAFLVGAVIGQCRNRPTNGTFGFSDTQANVEKTKRAIFSSAL